MCPCSAFTSCWIPGRSADCKKTFGVYNQCDGLDLVPADSQGAACLLHGNTLVSAQWQRKLCGYHSTPHNTFITAFLEHDSPSRTDWYTVLQDNGDCQSLLGLIVTSCSLRKSLSHCLVIISTSDTKNPRLISSGRNFMVFEWNWCVIPLGCVYSWMYSNSSLTNTGKEFQHPTSVFLATALVIIPLTCSQHSLYRQQITERLWIRDAEHSPVSPWNMV